MPVPLDVRTIRDATRLAALVAALDPTDQFRRVPQAMTSFTPDLAHVGLFPRMPPIPSWCYVDTGDEVVVCLAGIFSATDGLRFFASTLQQLTTVGKWRANAALVAVASRIAASLAVVAKSRPRDFVLGGHSYGGSLALVLAALLSDRGLASSVQVTTFGSPRPGDKSLSGRLASFNVRRWMNTGDPVPRFPLHIDEAPFMVAALPFSTAATWSTYTQPAGGVQLGLAGSVAAEELPSRVNPFSEVDLAVWAFSPNGFYAHPHQIGQYQDRLRRAALFGIKEGAVRQIGSPPEADVPLTAAAVAAAAAGVALKPPQPKREGIQVAGFIPVPFRAVAVKTGATYHVSWMGRIVYDAANKSAARSQARWLNTWLRKQRTAMAIHGTDLSDSLSEFLLSAVNPTLGFNPPANVV